MYCRKCGKKNNDSNIYCIYCSRKLDEEISEEIKEKDDKRTAESNYKSTAIISLILSVFIPFIGLILSIVYLSILNKSDVEKNDENEAAKKILVISLIISITIILFPILLALFAVFSSLMN